MIRTSLQELLLNNPPVQFQILHSLLGLFTGTHALESAYIRGSLSNNTYDRTSDIDLALSVYEDDFINLVESLDTLLEEHFQTLFPGWFDRIVPKFGGIGFVYLIPVGEKIFQIDLYVVPSMKLERLLATPSVKKVFQAEESKVQSLQKLKSVDAFISDYGRGSSMSYRSMFVETIVLAFLISKRIVRSQDFLNHSETVLLNQTFRDVLRRSFDPEHIDYGWYHLEANLCKVPRGEFWLEKLRKLVVAGRSIHTFDSLKETLNEVHALIMEFSPESINDLKDSYQYFLTKLGR